jgi:hypothetical protein
METRQVGIGKPRTCGPLIKSAFPRPSSSSLHVLPAYPSNSLCETATLAGVLWKELESGGVEHKMSTIGSPNRTICEPCDSRS